MNQPRTCAVWLLSHLRLRLGYAISPVRAVSTLYETRCTDAYTLSAVLARLAMSTPVDSVCCVSDCWFLRDLGMTLDLDLSER